MPSVVGEMKVKFLALELARLPDEGQEALPVDRLAAGLQVGELKKGGVEVHADDGVSAKRPGRHLPGPADDQGNPDSTLV